MLTVMVHATVFYTAQQLQKTDQMTKIYVAQGVSLTMVYK